MNAESVPPEDIEYTPFVYLMSNRRHPVEEIPMKLFSSSAVLWTAFLLLSTRYGLAQPSYDLRSPDNRIEIRIRTTQRIKYDVLFKGNVLLQDCTLSLNVEHQAFGVLPKITASKERSYD